MAHKEDIYRFVKAVLQEDIGRGDLFAKCIVAVDATAKIIAKEDGILSGVVYAQMLSKIADFKIKFNFEDGSKLKKGDIIAVVSGKNTTLLSIERTLLNMLQHSSGIATNAKRIAKMLKGSSIKLLDTRKTRPLLRVFEKYSSRNGGVINHRMGLDDTLMIKDTHLKTIGNLQKFIKNARKNIPFTAKIEIECETIEQVKEALKCNVDMIMCDNMDIDTIKQAVKLRDKLSPKTLIEVSGNITKENIAKYKEINIDAISSGSIIHQATWLDFSMKMD